MKENEFYSGNLTKKDFDDLIESCCDTLRRNKSCLFELYKNDCRSMDVIISLRPGEVATMSIATDHNVKSKENIIRIFN